MPPSTQPTVTCQVGIRSHAAIPCTAPRRQYRDAPIQLENNYFPKTMLGLEQKTWLWEHIGASTAKWKVRRPAACWPVRKVLPSTSLPDSSIHWYAVMST